MAGMRGMKALPPAGRIVYNHQRFSFISELVQLENAVNYFIINPVAGRRYERKKIRKNIGKALAASKTENHVYETKRAGDGADFMLRTAAESAGRAEELRFYFCGGDGTVMEAAGAFMKLPEELRKRAAVGIIPIGTGNDFIRNFGGAKAFLDIGRQLRGEAVGADLMRFTRDGEVSYGANMFNIGFDCQVVKKVNEMRDRPFMTQKTAYPAGVVHTLVKYPHTELSLEFDSGETHTFEKNEIACVRLDDFNDNF